MKRFILAAFLLGNVSLFAQAPATAPATGPVGASREAYVRVAAEVEKSLQEDDFKKFFPATVDDAGGFFQNFTATWAHAARPADTTRSVVYQARLTWLAAMGAMRYPDQAAEYLKYARHGADFLINKQWDAKAGGFWWSVDPGGRSLGDSKHVYGNAFAIYALATEYKATHDAAALEAAKRGFAWLEAHAHDNANGGYVEQLKGDGTPQDSAGGARDVLGAAIGQKSMNSHIHLLEAFTALLEVWPDDLVKKRTEEVYQISLTKIYAEPGYLHMFFKPDWTPIDGRDSYGHDIETAFLFAEAAAALGKPDDEACWNAGRHIVDHCLKVGFDGNGGLNNEGTVDGTGTIDRSKVWWVQAESLNALLLMHERYGKEPKYWEAFMKEWEFIKKNQIDAKNGGWFNTLNPDNTPQGQKSAKTDAWTEGYHQGRSMLTVSAALKAMAGR